jgi:predicted nucleic acid-binding protein
MIKFYYLDANCLVKLVVDEEFSKELRDHCGKQGVISATTSFCFYEALGVLKSKWINKKRPDSITEETYLSACEALCTLVEDEQIQLDDEVEIHNRPSFNESEKLTKKYKIDLSDSFQLVSLRKGMLAKLKTEIVPTLISEDDEIYRAAIGEGLNVLKINEL